MNYEPKENTVALFKNDEKKGERDPDYKGNGRVQGCDFWCSAWINEAKSGKKYMSVKFTEKNQMPQQQRAEEPQQAADIVDDLNDPIPF